MNSNAAMLIKSLVAIAAIGAVIALAIAKSITGAEAIDFVKWTLGFWMASLAVSAGASAISKAMDNRTDVTAAVAASAAAAKNGTTPNGISP